MTRFSIVCFVALMSLMLALPARAFPGMYISKKSGEPLVANEAHVVVMKQGARSVVSLMTDYEGPLEPFAVVLPVPSDVTLERVQTLRREFVDRVDQLSAPRFHEFWEMDPCEPGKAVQEWERNLQASSTTDFLGGNSLNQGGGEKVAKELLMNVKSEYKEGEYTFSLTSADEAKQPAAWLKGKGYKLSADQEQALAPYASAGMLFLLGEVDDKRIELVGGERAQLSPIRFWTETAYDTVPSRVGLTSLAKFQELFVYVFNADAGYEPKNYKHMYPPTNIEVSFDVKERMGEFYTALHDIILSKNPETFLVEYAWPSEGCGEPCPNEPLMIHELLSLGADVFEETVSDEEKNPTPAEQTKEEKEKEKAKLEELKPAERPKAKKAMQEEREELARRKALLARNKYILSRMHYRYDKSGLKQDPKIGPMAKAVRGGNTLPKGQEHELPTEVKPADSYELQTRYVNYHPWDGMMKCEKPQRWRWGKAPRHVRVLRKIWVAEDLSRKNRKQIDPQKVVMTPIAALGLSGASAASDAGTADAAAPSSEPEKKKSCGCRAVGDGEGSRTAWLLALFPLAIFLGRRRRDG